MLPASRPTPPPIAPQAAGFVLVPAAAQATVAISAPATAPIVAPPATVWLNDVLSVQSWRRASLMLGSSQRSWPVTCRTCSQALSSIADDKTASARRLSDVGPKRIVPLVTPERGTFPPWSWRLIVAVMRGLG